MFTKCGESKHQFKSTEENKHTQHRKRVVYQYDELSSSRGLLYGEIGLAITYLEAQSGNLSMVI